MRAEWRRIEAEVLLFVKWEGNELYALHELGYRFTENIRDLTPLQRWTLIAIRERVISQIRGK